MRYLIALLLASPAFAALATPPPLARPGWHDCTVRRGGPAGTFSVIQSIPPEGTGGPRQTYWRPPIEDNGVNVTIAWEQPGPIRIESGRVIILLFTPPARVEVYRIGPDGERETRFTGQFAPPDRMAGAGMDWASFLAMARGAAALEVAAVDTNGRVIRSVRVLTGDLERVADLVAGIRTEFDAIVADYRNRCYFRDPHPAG